MASFTVQFTSDDLPTEIRCDGYAQEGTMLTFFRFGTDCDTIDAWSRRVASYRISDVSSVVRNTDADLASVGVTSEEVPVLIAC